jgi:hypothetical protein
MGICPKDFLPCCDDICRGGGCIRLQGMPMYTRCNGCNQPVAIDGSDDDMCTCPPDWDDEPEWDEHDEQCYQEYLENIEYRRRGIEQ